MRAGSLCKVKDPDAGARGISPAAMQACRRDSLAVEIKGGISAGKRKDECNGLSGSSKKRKREYRAFLQGMSGMQWCGM